MNNDRKQFIFGVIVGIAGTICFGAIAGLSVQQDDPLYVTGHDLISGGGIGTPKTRTHIAIEWRKESDGTFIPTGNRGTTPPVVIDDK